MADRKDGIIRWKSVVPGITTLVATIALAFFCLDWMVEWGIEKAGTMANGAKVDVGSVYIGWTSASVTVNRLQVTDKSAPMTNAFEVATMKFAITPKPLFWRKFIIEKGEINGIQTGTPRRWSGAVAQPPLEEGTPTGQAAKPAGPDATREALKALKGNIADQFDPDKLKPEDLASYRKVQEEKARIADISGKWDGQVDGLKTDTVTAQANALIAKVKAGDYSGAAGAKQAAADLKEAQRLQAEVKQLQENAAKTKNSITSEVKATQNTVSQIDALKKQDMETAMKVGGGLFSAEGLTRAVLGPEWTGKVDTALGWFRNIRKFMPKKDKKTGKPAPPPAREGKNIEFKFHYNWPTFHLKKATLNGVTSGENPIEYDGFLTDVTSDPVKVGRPIVLSVAGTAKKAAKSLKLSAILDYTKEKARETVRFNYSGMELDNVALGNLGGPAGIKSGRASISANLETSGEAVSGQVDFNASPVKLSHDMEKDAAKQKLMAAVHDAILGMDTLQVTFLVSGRLASPNIGIRSSMDKAFQSAVNAAMKKELDAARAKYQEKIDGMVDGEKNKLSSMVTDKSKAALGKLGVKSSQIDSAKSSLDKVIADLKKKGTAGAVNVLPKKGFKF